MRKHMSPKQVYWISIIIILTIALTIACMCEFDFGNVTKLLDTKLVEVPVGIKCQFEEPDCMEGDIDGWSIAYGLVYFIVGLIYPNRYLGIAILSVTIEVLGPCIGFKPKYIIHPLIAITTYSIGSIIQTKLN